MAPGSGRSPSTRDVRSVSHDWGDLLERAGATFIPTQEEEILAQLRLSILNQDPPHHNRARRLVSKAFTPRMIAKLVAEIDRRAEAVIDSVIERGECEFVEEIAAQVPVQMICEMIGLESEQWPRMFEISNDVIGARNDPEYADVDTEAASAEIFMLCDAVAEDRRTNPRDDLMTALVQARSTASDWTTPSSTSFSSRDRRGQRDHPEPDQPLPARDGRSPGPGGAAASGPSLWDRPPRSSCAGAARSHNFRRTASRDTQLRGVDIAEGDKVVIYYASANRDEDVFDQPHTFDVARTPNDHVTFGGGGVHYCLGASLARAEIRATMRQVVDRLPGIALAGQPRAARQRLRQRHQADARHLVNPDPATSTLHRKDTTMRTPICDELGIEFPIFAFTPAATSSSRSRRPAASARAPAPWATRPSSSRSS